MNCCDCDRLERVGSRMINDELIPVYWCDKYKGYFEFSEEMNGCPMLK